MMADPSPEIEQILTDLRAYVAATREATETLRSEIEKQTGVRYE